MTAVTDLERRALAAIVPSSVVSLLTRLVRLPSTGGSDAESDIQHLIARQLSELGLDVDLWALDLPTLTGDREFPGVECSRAEAWGLVGVWPGVEDDEQPALALQGHVDVVPPGDPRRWSSGPFEAIVRNDRVHGRGTCDMKAGVTANLMAVAAIRAAGIRLRRSLALHLVVGEEDGGLGAFGTLRRGHTAEACVITEPTSGTLITANAGALTFTVEVPGAATHASTAYVGSSAIDSYIAIHQGLHDLQQSRNRDVDARMREYPVAYPISVGRLRAGDWPSSVPDLLVADGRMGLAIDEDPMGARQQLEEHVAGIALRDPFLRDHPPRISWSGGQFAGGSFTAGHPLGPMVAQAHADATRGYELRERGAPYGSDLRLYQAVGIPTLHYGPGEVHLAHGPHESVSIAETLTVTEALVLTTLRTCGIA